MQLKIGQYGCFRLIAVTQTCRGERRLKATPVFRESRFASRSAAVSALRPDRDHRFRGGSSHALRKNELAWYGDGRSCQRLRRIYQQKNVVRSVEGLAQTFMVIAIFVAVNQ